MSQVWYFQVMGAEVGPLSGPELADKVKRGQVQADTLIRKGTDGKWMPADRIKGLLPPPPEVAPPVAAVKTTAAAASSESKKSDVTASQTAANPLADEDDETYHFTGDKAAAATPHAEPTEFDFFQFVGFRHAITHPLHEVLEAYAHQHRLTFTQITRRALAQVLGRPELGEDKKPEPPPEPPVSDESAATPPENEDQ